MDPFETVEFRQRGHRWYATSVGEYSIDLSVIGSRCWWRVTRGGMPVAEGVACCCAGAELASLRCVWAEENGPDTDPAAAGPEMTVSLVGHGIVGCASAPSISKDLAAPAQ
jgi:hypothetical protein